MDDKGVMQDPLFRFRKVWCRIYCPDSDPATNGDQIGLTCTPQSRLVVDLFSCCMCIASNFFFSTWLVPTFSPLPPSSLPRDSQSRCVLQFHCFHWTENHVVDWKEAKVIKLEQVTWRRKILEAIHMQQEKRSTTNLDYGVHLSPIWSPFVAGSESGQ